MQPQGHTKALFVFTSGMTEPFHDQMQLFMLHLYTVGRWGTSFEDQPLDLYKGLCDNGVS